MRKRRREGFEMLVRPRNQRLLLGVCAGIAVRYQVDVTLVRLAFLLASLAWGLGVIVYLALWLVTPTEGAQPARNIRGMAGRNVRSARLEVARSQRRIRGAWMDADAGKWPRPLNRRWLGIGLVAAGLLVLLASMGVLSWVTPWRAMGLAVIALGVATLISLQKS